ncbi:cytochrome c biogenesis protein CcdA [Saxibacter everestensis]|uniref:Cytochrome c biogenesis protein CcdA n=2 Tax=Saxibacter everestensis TaxID=2909229 RepID=A0ABY8QYK4_9MICO|nr:cytochrome c biogenesis protein CcdA [Brevibacteriaceae bacterium ZFBP1038]
MLLAIPVAALAGVVSFLSPCVLPLVPGYVGYVTGLSGTDLEQQKSRRVLLGVGLFVLGFAAVFVSIGLVFSLAGVWLKPWIDPITRILGLVVILAGVVFLGGFSWLQRDRRIHSRPPAGLWGAPVLGITFGLGWAPCTGPTLAAVVALSTSMGATAGPGVARGALLTFVYCLGLGIPFLIVAMLMRRGMGRLKFFRDHRIGVMRFGGAMLIVIGVLLVSGLWTTWVASLQGMIGGFVTVI